MADVRGPILSHGLNTASIVAGRCSGLRAMLAPMRPHALGRIAIAAVAAAGMAGVTVTLPAPALAQQKFPTKPIRLLVGIGVGGQSDTLARMVGQKMSEGWGQAVVVDNRTAAGGALAAGIVAKAVPDGHTLLYSVGFAISAALQPNLPYDPLKDFAGVAHFGIGTQILSVSPALGVKSVEELIALAKAQPGKIIFGSPPVGSGTHLSGARFNFLTGIKVVTVAFNPNEVLLQLLAGRTHYSVTTIVLARPFLQDGKLLPLAVLLPQRSPLLPEVPALAETLPEFKRPEVSAGLLAPAGTPRTILNQISKEVARVLDLPDVKERLNVLGFHPQPSTPEEYDKIVRAQIETLSKLVRDIGLRPK
jgi:tripartite-type tricarboxylate transporter receptor subunit TctC